MKTSRLCSAAYYIYSKTFFALGPRLYLLDFETAITGDPIQFV